MDNDKHVLMVMIDGFANKYINKIDTPFLYELQSNSLNLKTKQTALFGDYSVYNGRYETEHGLLAMYYYDSTFSGHKPNIPKFINVLDSINNYYWRIIIRRMVSKIFNNENFKALIPSSISCFFTSASNEAINPRVDTLFDILGKHNKSSIWYGRDCPYLSEKSSLRNRFFKKQFHKKIHTWIKDIIQNHNYNFIHYELPSFLDHYGHKYGPASDNVKTEAKRNDSSVKELVAIFRKKYPEGVIVVCSDHGMHPVDKSFDIIKLLSENGIYNEKDYICFKDSTDVRFYKVAKGKKEPIIDLLNNSGFGFVMGEKESNNWKIAAEERWGEIIFVCNPGIVLKNDYFRTSIPKGMHGYLVDQNEWCQPIFMLTGPQFKPETIIAEQVDFMPTILDLFQIDYKNLSLPGRSLLKK